MRKKTKCVNVTDGCKLLVVGDVDYEFVRFAVGELELYGGPQLSRQNQMLTANYKALTSNSNRSHQIQIAHSKFKSLKANYKSLTANSNRPQQIQIVHSKLQIIDSARRLRLSTASGTTRLKIFVIHEAATL